MRPELALDDFALCGEMSRLLRLLDETRGGAIRLIEVRDGIPRRMLVESQAYCTTDPAGRDLKSEMQRTAWYFPAHNGPG